MNILDIESFLAIASCGTISKAAEKLFITQPALSLKIESLEKELGCKLFIRKRGIRSVELTAEGKQFIQLADRYKSLRDEMHHLSHTSSELPLRLSAINSINTVIIPNVILDFLNQFPHARLEEEDLASMASYDAIEAKLIDLAFIVDTRYSIKSLCEPLFSEKMKFVCNVNNNFPRHLTVKSLDQDKEIYSPWFLEFEQWHDLWFNRNARPRVQVQTMNHLSFFLQQPGSWSIVPATVEYSLRKYPYIVFPKLHSDIPDRVVKYLTHTDIQSRYTVPFIEATQEYLKELESKNLIKCRHW
ncbi:MAG: LysR family transcriptional regulator [Acidaminococcaceae bacterium]|jgi:DNA-binding transcriptional LysR family regulator|nr:LysR family transcriptional regulator [Acidaminococcaceae bacterium]